MHYSEVLIIGAGPTGLMMACQLAIHNIPFRIIDKNEDHTTQSRALVVQARSLEIFRQMGISGQALAQGTIAKAIGAFLNGKKILRIPVSEIGKGLTEFPFFLMLEQSHTESILVDFLKRHGHEVERKKELVKLNQNSEHVVSILKDGNGKEETISTKFLIGADGSHSVVREQLNITFGGKTYETSLFVMDCQAEVVLPHDGLYLAFSNTSLGGFFPLTNGRWRILGSLPKSLEGREQISFEDIEKDFAPGLNIKARLYDPQWISVYRSHHRYASTFRKDRCFLAGDAAHIHSPVGAQGMNTGLQDAYNLAWKLAVVIKGNAKDSLLDTYTEERIAIAKSLVRTTDRVFNVITSENSFLKNFKIYIVPALLKLAIPVFKKMKSIQQFAFKTGSEIGIHYRKSSLSLYGSIGNFPRHAPKPGDRLPYFLFKDGAGNEINIQTKIRNSFFCFIVFNDRLPEEILSSVGSFKDLCSFEILPFTKQTETLYERFGIKENGYFLVRPDRYISYRSNQHDAEHLKTYLQLYF
jgi:2-polyprenyl-6-methoxyphenol hydroxylase-like FAD-dependent oxidoreductase